MNIQTYLTEDALSFIANDGVDIVGELLVDDQFDCTKFERYYAAWEEGNDESIEN